MAAHSTQSVSHTAEFTKLHAFVVESNRIEGILRPPTQTEMDAHAAFLPLREVTMRDMENFVHAVASAPLRRNLGMDVRVGPHLPPPGGPGIERELQSILRAANGMEWSPYDTHVQYETVHPFMDGNGRSGRLLWAWMMLRDQQDPFALPFLHRWYYQSLDEGRG